MRIQSRVGEGTQASLRIPNKYRVAAGVATVEHAAAQTPAVTSRRARLILVEDNDGVRVATELFLKLEGHETLSARTVAEAEVLLERLAVGDVVIADYHLDGKNTGLDLLLRLRERVGYDVPGVILSGDLPSVLRSIKSPVVACHFLSKPVNTAALVDAIAELSTTSPSLNRGVA